MGLLTVCFLASFGLPSPVSAATVSLSANSVITSASGTQVLNDAGAYDWAYWNPSAGSGAVSGNPTNRRSGGTLISSLTTIGGGNLRTSGSSTSNGVSFGFSNGTSPASGTTTSLSVFHSDLGTTGEGKGLSLSVAAPTLSTFYVTAWVTTFNAEALFTATLGSQTATATVTSTGSRTTHQLTFEFMADALAQSVGLSYVMTDAVGNDGNANAGIQAIRVSSVPEPSRALLMAAGLMVSC